MSFTSVSFMFFFFPLFFIGALCLKKYETSVQNIFLLIASLIFYSWCGVEYTLFLIVEILLNYFLAIIFDNHREKKNKKIFLIIGILLNVGILGICKYYNFFAEIIESIVNLFLPQVEIYSPNIPLPLGISFIVFQLIAYLADVYMGKVDTERNFLNFLLYVLFFPKIVMGPITRYADMAENIRNRSFSRKNWEDGLIRFCIGFVKKILLANQMATVADSIFGIDGGNNFIIAWIGAIAYTLQIYIDFSSYTDMAIGIAQMLGFSLPENFDYPYLSKGIKEFWRRWHISLSNWFRDYVYIPLGGNRTTKWKVYRNLGTVFLLTGLWHGADWSFIVWGAYHGFFNILESIKLKEILKKVPIVAHIYTMVVVIIGWVFFRADTLTSSLRYLKSMCAINVRNIWQLEFWQNVSVEAGLAFFFSIIICIPPKKIIRNDGIKKIILILLFLLSIYYMLSSGFKPFIYLKF